MEEMKKGRKEGRGKEMSVWNKKQKKRSERWKGGRNEFLGEEREGKRTQQYNKEWVELGREYYKKEGRKWDEKRKRINKSI